MDVLHAKKLLLLDIRIATPLASINIAKVSVCFSGYGLLQWQNNSGHKDID